MNVQNFTTQMDAAKKGIITKDEFLRVVEKHAKMVWIL